MPRGGKRQGAPGQAYSNRTDLNQNYSAPASAAPQVPPQVPVAAPAQPGQPTAAAPVVTPDMTPMPSDPTLRSNEPVTTGIAEVGRPGIMPPEVVNPGIVGLRNLFAATGDLRILPLIEFNERFR